MILHTLVGWNSLCLCIGLGEIIANMILMALCKTIGTLLCEQWSFPISVLSLWYYHKRKIYSGKKYMGNNFNILYKIFPQDQAITWSSVYSGPWCHMASLGHNELMLLIRLIAISTLTIITYLSPNEGTILLSYTKHGSRSWSLWQWRATWQPNVGCLSTVQPKPDI